MFCISALLFTIGRFDCDVITTGNDVIVDIEKHWLHNGVRVVKYGR